MLSKWYNIFMKEYTHNCIKCSTQYKSNEDDAYYCEPCNEEKKAIAKEVDAKMANHVSKRQVKSSLQIYDEIRKQRGVNFVNINDLGIKL